MKKVINLNNTIVYYNVSFKDKKNISIKLDSCGEIIVYAPIGVSYKYIESILLKKQKWIITNIEKIKNSYLNDKDKIIFLGNQYIPQIENSEKEKINIYGEYIFIKTKSLNKEYIKAMLMDWYKTQANEIIINIQIIKLFRRVESSSKGIFCLIYKRQFTIKIIRHFSLKITKEINIFRNNQISYEIN